MTMDFGSKEVEPRLMRGLFLGTIKNSPDFYVGPKVSMWICLNWMA